MSLDREIERNHGEPEPFPASAQAADASAHEAVPSPASVTGQTRIASLRELRIFIAEDMRVNHAGARPTILLRSPIVRWLLLLRIVEYLHSRTHRYAWWPVMAAVRIYFHRLSVWLGFSIPPGTCGPGLCLPHYGPIIVNARARVGARGAMHPGVTIGASRGKVPTIGNDVILDPGAKIFGGVTMADGSRAAANAVVTSDVQSGEIAFGVPARARPRRE